MEKSRAIKTFKGNHHNFLPAEQVVTHSLPAERFRLSLEIKSLTVLPPYKGGIFRGAFGSAFRRAVCAISGVDCNACILREKCLYVSLFEPSPPPGFKDSAKFPKAPPPYVLNPPMDNRQAFRPGQTLAFDLVLIGRAIDALPYFIYSFIEMGRRGLGRERGKYVLANVELIRNGRTTGIYDAKTQTLKGFEDEPGPAPPDNQDIKDLTIRLLTPLRLKEKSRLVTTLTFPLFFDRLIHRLSLLTSFYGPDGPISIPDSLRSRTEKIQTKSDKLHWYDWERYSARQKSLMKLGGLRGDITFEGNLSPFMPYLRLAEMVNVGQGTSFGLGRFEVVTS